MSDIKLRQANPLDAKSLFDLRNHPAVRQQSNNAAEIDIYEHQRWFDAVMSNRSRQILIAEQGEKFVGMVRFDCLDDSCRMSWAIIPKTQGQGLGKQMLKMAIEQMKGCTLSAEIKHNNFASIKIAEYVGMKLIKQTRDILLYQNDY